MNRRTLLTLIPAARAYERTPQFDHVLEFAKTTTKHGGVLVQIDGRLVFEKYFGVAHRDATPNLASVGKSVRCVPTATTRACSTTGCCRRKPCHRTMKESKRSCWGNYSA